MKYKVITQCYDDTTKISIAPASDDESTHSDSFSNYDLYVDVFDDEASARAFYDASIESEKSK